MILYISPTAFCLLLFFYLLLFLCPNHLLSLNTEGHKLSSSISALRFAISELSSLSYSFFFHPLYLHLLSVSFLKWLLSQCDLELPYRFSPLAAVYISHRLCIFDLKEFPASSAFDFLSSSILLTSVTSLVACPLEMKNLWAVSAVTKNSSLCQLSAMLRPTFFSANNFFSSRNISLCRSPSLMPLYLLLLLLLVLILLPSAPCWIYVLFSYRFKFHLT